MRMHSALIATPLAALALVFTSCTGGDDGGAGGGKTAFVNITTGGQSGVYYPVGGHIANLVNEGSDEHGIKANVSTSNGSVENINLVMSGEFDFGLAQSDRQYQAIEGKAEWQDNAQEGLRAVCSLHPEVITLVAAAEIESLAGLAGKRVSIGSPGSGQRQNAIDVLTAAGIDPEQDIQAEGLAPAEAPRMLQDDRIDAFFYTAGHPNGAITEATSGSRQVRLIDLEPAFGLLDEYPYYATSTIPGGTYPQAADGGQDVRSISMLTTLVTREAVSEDVVYALTKAVFENLDRFRGLHPALKGLTAEGMLEGLSAPLHPGAERYYREAGLLAE